MEEGCAPVEKALTVKVRRPTWWLLPMLAGMLLAPPAGAKPPTLDQIPGVELPDTYQVGKSYTVRMRYTDPEGDPPKKAQFVYEGPSGRNPKDFTNIEGRDYRGGVTIEWTLTGFEQGSHRAYFTAASADGQTRYPPADGQFYTFVVQNPATQWVIMGAGLLVGLLFVPFLVYVLARAANKRGDPSGAARIGLLLGILACAALFIYLFADIYGPLAYGIGIIAALALLVLVLTRR
jgi:hypothetical protein